MNGILRYIGPALCFASAFLALVRRQIGIDDEDFGWLFSLLLFSGLTLTIWFVRSPRPQIARIAIWLAALYIFFSVGLSPLVDWNPSKAILLVLTLLLLLVSEWRYARPTAEQLMAGSHEGTVKTTARNLLIWLAVTTSLVLLWQLIRLIL